MRDVIKRRKGNNACIRLINDRHALLVSLQIDRNNYYCRNPLLHPHCDKKDENNVTTRLSNDRRDHLIDHKSTVIIIYTHFAFNNDGWFNCVLYYWNKFIDYGIILLRSFRNETSYNGEKYRMKILVFPSRFVFNRNASNFRGRMGANPCQKIRAPNSNSFARGEVFLIRAITNHIEFVR